MLTAEVDVFYCSNILAVMIGIAALDSKTTYTDSSIIVLNKLSYLLKLKSLYNSYLSHPEYRNNEIVSLQCSSIQLSQSFYQEVLKLINMMQ